MSVLEYLENVRKIKQEIGFIDSDELTESMRNKGANRTPEKRELLRIISEKTKNSDNRVISYF